GNGRIGDPEGTTQELSAVAGDYVQRAHRTWSEGHFGRARARGDRLLHQAGEQQWARGVSRRDSRGPDPANQRTLCPFTANSGHATIGPHRARGGTTI